MKTVKYNLYLPCVMINEVVSRLDVDVDINEVLKYDNSWHDDRTKAFAVNLAHERIYKAGLELIPGGTNFDGGIVYKDKLYAFKVKPSRLFDEREHKDISHYISSLTEDMADEYQLDQIDGLLHFLPFSMNDKSMREGLVSGLTLGPFSPGVVDLRYDKKTLESIGQYL
ncbi:MAG: hypothetical protein ACQEP1_00720 [Nanobdellota archaeon]